MKPLEIEQLSFQIIDTEAVDHGFPPDQWPLVRRVIHTSADFEWQEMIRLHPRAIACGVAAIRAGAPYDGNLLRPCMIIDRPDVLRRVCRDYGARPTHPGAESIISELAGALDARAACVARIMDDVWNRGEWQHLYVTAGEIHGRGAAREGVPEAARAGHGERRH